MVDFSLVVSHLTKQESGVCGHELPVQQVWVTMVRSMDWEILCRHQ
ncbi:TPA: hypothetical protein U1D20_001866 [Streptococcus suis]|nr:hypothetical protein [Streptococcus suis]